MSKKKLINSLKIQLNNAKIDSQSLKLSLGNKQKEYHLKRELVKKLENQLEHALLQKEITISDHARLRYLERVCGIDTTDIDQKILDHQAKELIDKLGGNGTYPSYDFSIVIKNYNVVTVVKEA